MGSVKIKVCSYEEMVSSVEEEVFLASCLRVEGQLVEFLSSMKIEV